MVFYYRNVRRRLNFLIFFQDFQSSLFGSSIAPLKDEPNVHIAQALCLPIAVSEIIQTNHPSGVNVVILAKIKSNDSSLPCYIYNGNLFPSLNPAKIFRFNSR